MKKYLLLIVVVAALAGCASTNYQAFEGRDTTRVGQGGTKKTIDGVDLWDNGDPPRLYQVLGFIDDERGGDGISRHMRDGDIAKKVKEAGGDAAIIMSSQSQFTGMVSSGTANAYSYGNQASAFGTGFSAPTSRTLSKYVVVKYVK